MVSMYGNAKFLQRTHGNPSVTSVVGAAVNRIVLRSIDTVINQHPPDKQTPQRCSLKTPRNPSVPSRMRMSSRVSLLP